MTHATRALQRQYLSGEGINFGSQTHFFDYTKTWRASPDEWSAQCLGHLRDNTNIVDDTHHSLIHSNKANMKWWLWRPNDIRETRGPKASWHLSDRWGKNRKTSPKKLVPNGNRSRARCVTGAHATACSTAVDPLNYYPKKIECKNIQTINLIVIVILCG